MHKLLVLCLALTGCNAFAGIPVVDRPIDLTDLTDRVQQLLAQPEMAERYPELASAYAEKVRQREADAYNRQKARDLKRAAAQARARVPAAAAPAAARPTAQ